MHQEISENSSKFITSKKRLSFKRISPKIHIGKHTEVISYNKAVRFDVYLTMFSIDYGNTNKEFSELLRTSFYFN